MKHVASMPAVAIAILTSEALFAGGGRADNTAGMRRFGGDAAVAGVESK